MEPHNRGTNGNKHLDCLHLGTYGRKYEHRKESIFVTISFFLSTQQFCKLYCFLLGITNVRVNIAEIANFSGLKHTWINIFRCQNWNDKYLKWIRYSFAVSLVAMVALTGRYMYNVIFLKQYSDSRVCMLEYWISTTLFLLYLYIDIYTYIYIYII